SVSCLRPAIAKPGRFCNFGPLLAHLLALGQAQSGIPAVPNPTELSLSCRVREKRANDVSFFLRQTGKAVFIEMSFTNKPGKDEKKLRVAIIEHLVDLSSPLAQIVVDFPHVGRRRRGVGLPLEFGHDLGERRLKRFIEGAARDLLFRWRPSKVIQIHGGSRLPHPHSHSIVPSDLNVFELQAPNFFCLSRRTISPIRQQFALSNSKRNFDDRRFARFSHYRHQSVRFCASYRQCRHWLSRRKYRQTRL